MYKEAVEDIKYQNLASSRDDWELSSADMEEVQVQCVVARVHQRGLPDLRPVNPMEQLQSFTEKLSGNTEDEEKKGESYMRSYQTFPDRTDLKNTVKKPVMQSDPLRSGGYSHSKIALSSEGLDHRRLYV